MKSLPLRTDAIGLIFSTLLLLAVLLLGAWAMWMWWYIAQLPTDQAGEIGLAVRLAPVATTLVVVCLWMGGLLLTVDRAFVLPVIGHYRWRFGCCLAVTFGIFLVALRMLMMRPYQWGGQDEQMLLLGGFIGGLLIAIALVGVVGYWVAGRLDARYQTNSLC